MVYNASKTAFLLGIYAALICAQGFASSTWIGTSSSDLNTPTNWSPIGVPTASDVADFDSLIPGINTTPNATADFAVDSFNFLDSASAFSFSFENCSLTIAGEGITGNNTDTSITVENIDNTSGPVTTNLEFSNSSTAITSGRANISLLNSASIFGAVSNVTSSEISSSQLIVGNPFFMSSNGSLTVENTGTDISLGSGNNASAFTSLQQADFTSTFSVGDNVVLDFSNSGFNGGSGSGNRVGGLEDGQLTVAGTFLAGDDLSLTATNTGFDLSSSDGGNNVGYVFSRGLMEFSDNFIVGNNAAILGRNTGTYAGTSGVGGSNIGYESGTTFQVTGFFQASDDLILIARNEGTQVSSGVGGNRVGYTGGGQININNDMSLGNNAFIFCPNSGVYSGSNTGSGNFTGVVVQSQFNIVQSLDAQDDFTLNVSNTGLSQSDDIGNNLVGCVGGRQVRIGGPVTLGNRGAISCANSGSHTGLNVSANNAVGLVSGDQLDIVGAMVAGDSFTMAVLNGGTDQGSGGGTNAVGYVNGTQARFESTCTLGDDATFIVSNSGNSSTTSVDFVGVIAGRQLHLMDDFSSGKNLSINVSNSGVVSGASTQVGWIFGPQIEFSGMCSLGDNAFISAFNNGDGVVFGSQMVFQQGFDILNGKATFQALNAGLLSGGFGIAVFNGLGGNVNIILDNSSLFVDTPESTFTIGELNGDATSFTQVRPEFIIDTDAGVNADFAGDIQDFPAMTSTLTKRGVGTQRLSGANTFTGQTTIQEGTLVLTGSLAGNTQIETAGTLKGTGSISGNVVNFGTIAPGEGIGTIHFLSNYTNQGGNYAVEVNGAGLSDLIDVAGTATLNGGTVFVSSVDGMYRFQEPYTIVEAGSVVGTYSGAFSASLIQPIVTYDLQHVYLTLLTDIARAAETPNQLAVALQLDGIVNPNAGQTLLLSEIVDLPLDQARDGLDSLSGYQHAANFLTTQILNRQFIRRLYDPIRSIVTTEPCCCDTGCTPCFCEFTGWFDTGGSFINFFDTHNVHGFRSQGYNVTGGLQATLCHNLTVGAAGSYEHDSFHFIHNAGTERSSTWFAGLYGLYRPSCFYTFADLTYGHSSNHLKRSIRVGDLRYHARSKPNTAQYTFYGEIGVDWNYSCLLVQPFFGIDVGRFHRKCVRESFADGWGLVVRKRTRTISTTRLGVHLTANNFIQDQGSLSLDVAWNYLVSSPKNRIHERFREFGTPFEIEGSKINRNGIDYALTFTTPIYNRLSGYLEASGETWARANLFNAVAGIEFCW